jgi:hypothetical protein
MISSHFSTIGSSIANQIPDASVSVNDYIAQSDSTFNFEPITDSDVEKVLKNLDSNKAAGLDNLPAWILKESRNEISPQLRHIFNLSINSGTFIDKWKMARVTPIHKGGSKSDLNNYRPISILPLVSKVFEKIVFKQLYNYIMTNQLLLKDQFGFRPGHSTATCLISQINEWLQNIDNGQVNGIIQVDLRKAFDTVNHEILATKLSALGIHGLALNFFKSYLNNRVQKCQVNNILTSATMLTHGVPQGSVLGPLLFLIYINDLPACLQHTNACLYADDTQFYTSCVDVDELSNKLNLDLASLDDWLRANKLNLHADKTKLMFIGTRQRLVDTSAEKILINNNEIHPSDQMKSLGIIIDKNLNWNGHTDLIISKVKSGLGALRRAKPFVSKDTLKQIYNALIEPHFDYCAEVWGDLNKGLSDKLQKLQNRAARIITGESYDVRSSDVLKSLGWHPLHTRRDLILASLVYKCFHRQVPVSLQNVFTQLSSFTKYNLRGSNLNLHMKRFDTEYGKRSLAYRGAKLWNSLSLSTKAMPSIKTFKKGALNDIASLNDNWH